MQMKVLLTLPPDPGASFTMPDLGLGYLAASLQKANLPVNIVDSINESLTLDELITRIGSIQPDIVGIKFFSKDFYVSHKFLKKIKEIYPEITTVGGGPHPSCSDPKDLMEQLPDLDYAIRGEAEKSIVTFVKLIRSIRQGEKIDNDMFRNLPGLIWRMNDAVFSNPPDFIENLDELGFPAWDLLDPHKFVKKFEFSIFTKPPSVNIIATRGCPYPCSFCATSLTTGKKVRSRSVSNILEEISFLLDHYNIQTINFIDDNFTFHKSFVKAFCEEILKRKMKFEWHCPYGVRLNSLDASIVKLMEQSGCISIAVGIESGSSRILDHMKKKLSIDQIREQISMIKKNSKLKIQGFFILGYPEENREDIQKTILFARSLPLDMASFSLFCPIPGTPIYEQLVQQGKLIEPLKWDDYTMDSVVYAPDGISLEELNKYHRTAYMRFYLRPGVIFNLILQMRSTKQIRFLIWGFLHRLL
ncbi:MAG: hypothetical protein A2161_13480, partial [Candidatus Schekmanbacteria bacterium RBG_13_48_7]